MNKKDWDARQYKKHSKPQEESAKAILEQFPFHSDEVVLDIGCGDGKITKEIAAKVPKGKVIGIDPSPNMIEESKKNFSPVKNLSFVQAKAEDFHFDFPFDLIVSFFALHYVSNPKKALKNIFNSLKTGGTFNAIMAVEIYRKLKTFLIASPGNLFLHIRKKDGMQKLRMSIGRCLKKQDLIPL